ncbi:UTRA domain-containing protein [Lactiplantibacillus plantarum]|uniref:UTRA domain-containing protein n=1 Tax=Lactiplantibacillus plantarum TaxID=1590 RepID=UPI002877FDB8|nr:UTRA domain-containing protein [Lactiplantibacillus plantarum]
MACKNSFLLRDDLFIIPSLKSCLRNQLTSSSLFNYFEQQRDVNVGFIDQLLMSEPLPAIAREFMELPAGAPSLVVKDETYLTTGKMLAFSKQYYDYRRARLFMVKKIR